MESNTPLENFPENKDFWQSKEKLQSLIKHSHDVFEDLLFNSQGSRRALKRCQKMAAPLP